MPNTAPIIVLCTCPDLTTAHNLANTLLEQYLAACINIIPNITSVYRWQGVIENAAEYLLIIKTTSDVYTLLEDTISKSHPYQIPEIIALPIIQGATNYLNWMQENINVVH